MLLNHLEVLRASHVERQWVGNNLRNYARNVFPNCAAEQLQILPESQVDRKFLFSLAANSNVETKTCCIAIFAWGGMRRNHARTALNNPEPWLSIAQEIRKNNAERKESYRRFEEARRQKKLPGLGPAFFTKIIYFLGKDAKSRGYIMDQWTARSANLLIGKNLVHLAQSNNNKRVSDSNTCETYDAFCRFIEDLVPKLACDTPDAAEERLFSVGGRRHVGPWRAYVRKLT